MPRHRRVSRQVQIITPNLIQAHHPSQNVIVALSFSPSGQFLATALQHGAIQLHSPSRMPGHPTNLLGHTADVYQLEFSNEREHLASASLDHSVRLWNPTRSTACLCILQHGNMATAVAFHPFRHLLLTASSDGEANVWKFPSEEVPYSSSPAFQQQPSVAAVELPITPISATSLTTSAIIARASADAVFTAAVFVSRRTAALATYDGRLLRWRPAFPDMGGVQEYSSSAGDDLWDGFAPNHHPAQTGHQTTSLGQPRRECRLGPGCILLDLRKSQGNEDENGATAASESGPSAGSRISLTKARTAGNSLFATTDGSSVYELNGEGVIRNFSGGRVFGGIALSTGASPDGRLIVLGGIEGSVRLMKCPRGTRAQRSATSGRTVPARIVEVPVFRAESTIVSAVAVAGSAASRSWIRQPRVHHRKRSCVIAAGASDGSLKIVEVMYDVT